MQFVDAVAVAGVRKTREGYLIADARTARTGIQVYLGTEVDKADMATVRVYRPEEEVFKADSLLSFSHIPVTNDHPTEAVTADNWKTVAVGETGEDVLRDGGRLRIPLIVKDKAAIADVEGGKRELSVGYSCQLDWTAGITPQGEAYDAIQRNITANHVAIVHRGRAGSECRIGDSAGNWGASPITLQNDSERTSQMADNLRKVLVDGLQVETTDAGATAIEKLLNDLTSSAAKLTSADAAHSAAIAKKDEEIGALKADLKKAQDAAPKPADLDKMVADRVALITAATSVFKDLKTEGLSDAEIRKAAVAAKLGDEMVKDASEGEILGMFKAIAKDSANQDDPIRKALMNRDQNTTITDNGQAAYEKRLTDAWKTPAKGA